jgi:predicted MFS family arabinose efflux permease
VASEEGGTRSGWTVIVAYASVVAATQMLWLTFAPIDTDVARDFGVSQNAVGWLAQVFPLFYVVLALPAGIALDRWFRGALMAGAILTAAGGLLRLVSQDFAWALVGQIVVAFAQPLVLNALTKTASGYLPTRQRPAGIAVGSAGQFVGAVIALVMGPLLEAKHDLGPLLPVQAVLACIAALLLGFALRRPPQGDRPPAAIGLAEIRKVWSVPIMHTLTQLAFLGVGVFVAVSTWLQPILHHDHISSTDAGVMLAVMLVAGTVGCGVVPPKVAREGRERQYLMVAVVWVGCCCVLLALVHSVVVADFILIAAVGFVLLAALPVLLEMTERNMGALGGVATGILLMAGNAGGLIVAIVVGIVDHMPAVAFLVLAFVIFCGIPAARRVPASKAALDRV